MRFAQNQGATVVAITDSLYSPWQKTRIMLYSKSDMASFVDSLVAPLSVINALIVAIGMSRKTACTRTFERLEKIWDEYKVYEKQDYDSNYGEED